MGKTISFVKGKGSISHNNRDFIAENVDRNWTAWNVEYIKQPIREAYNQLFGEAIAEYNAKQKRKNRQVTDYLKDIKNSGNGEKQFYEIVVQIGKKDDTWVLDSEGNLSVDAKAASEILNAEKQEAESVIASVGAEIADAREEAEESKKHLDEINEQIADREKRYAVYEKKIDKVLAAGKPVAKELAVIRKNAKQLPSILGSEPSVKISEKDFNCLIDMAQASGTLEKLNEIYDWELEHIQGIIDDLMVQVKTWKDKVLQYDKFFNVKGLVEEFKELFIKAANRLFSERDEILANTKVMMEMVCETDSLDRDLQDSITELNIISEQMQIAIAESSLVQEVVVKAKDDIRFIFKNGFEVRV